MRKPELVLSNTTSFFIGGIQATFETAKRLGFQYLEIIPYRWTTPQEIKKLEQRYGIRVTGIHFPPETASSLWQEVRHRTTFLDKIFAPVWHFYLGNWETNPGLDIARALSPERHPYLLFHANLAYQLGERFAEITKTFHTVIENIPFTAADPKFYWDPQEILTTLKLKNMAANLVFDVSHFKQNLSQPDLLQTYVAVKPEILHIGYNSRGIHVLPDQQEQEELVQLLKLHVPRYIVLETNPLVSVARGKKILETIIQKSQNQ